MWISRPPPALTTTSGGSRPVVELFKRGHRQPEQSVNGAATPRGEVPLAAAQGLVVRGQASPLHSDLALMASVGNVYDVKRLQAFRQSAVPGVQD